MQEFRQPEFESRGDLIESTPVDFFFSDGRAFAHNSNVGMTGQSGSQAVGLASGVLLCQVSSSSSRFFPQACLVFRRWNLP
jgi:hypothetical protein